ncbi:MAG: serine hydrolase [Pirellulaceae bacterium]|jgi:CubicO group peptidase (beta-lactamase class C family)|nr:serine hydrolase [Pirellulaceae bacterium]
MVRIGLAILFTVAVVRGAFANEPTDGPRQLEYGEPADVGVDAGRLDRAVSIVRHAVEDGEIPGAVVLVAHRGRVILQEAFGFRDIERTQPMQTDSLFRMASNSKAVTAAGIMLLVEEGKLDLDAPVGTCLPAFDNDAWRPVTIRHLLTHTSGTRIKPLFLTPLLTSSSDHPQAPDLRLEVNRFAEIPPDEKPGTTYSYSNAGFNTLAAVIEHVVGSYKEHLRTRLYEPLGMRDTCNHETDADHDRMSTVMKRQADGMWKAGWTPGDPPDWPFPRGSGGMVSTAWDYAVFCQMLLNEGSYGGKQILSPATVREMTNPQSAHCEAARTYGLGWRVAEPNGVFSHTGSDGTYVWVDPVDDVIGMVLTQTNSTTRPRDAFRRLIQLACDDRSVEHKSTGATARQADGFYKDVFMSGGKNLTSRTTLYAAESLGLSYEYYAGSDASWQNQMLIGNPADENGVLLYPDGEPRFRMLYVNGGGATNHGKSLTQAGRDRLRQLYRSGGSYCGSCAGSFLSGRNVDDRSEPRPGYLHIFPFNTLNTGIKKTRVGHQIPDDSPLLRYRNFGDDYAVNDVYHNNGNWLRVDEDLDGMAEVEVLARYDHPGHRADGGAAIWAYWPDENVGRIVNIGSHPEGSSGGEKLALTEACFLYALAGTGLPQLKATLQYGEPRKMNRCWSDNKPERARIGDRQYHHFAFVVSPERPHVKIELYSDQNVDLHLFLSDKSLAFRKQATHVDVRSGATKTIQRELKPGRWYVSVYCATTVETINDADSGFHRFVGDRSVLNGAAYAIRVSR